MGSLNDDKITLFQSGIGDGNDLMLGFPSYGELLKDGQEIFDILHRLKGFDSTKVVPFYPMQNFLYMVKAAYKVLRMSEFGLIDFRVDMLRPHNYRFKLAAAVMDNGVSLNREWVLQGTIDRDSMVHTIIEFDAEIFLPLDIFGNTYRGEETISYSIENLTGSDIFDICFYDNETVSEGFQFIKAVTVDDTPFIHPLDYERNFVASPVTETKNYQRRQLNNIPMNMWLYPDIRSTLTIGYLCKETINGILLEYGVSGLISSGMDFPYRYNFSVMNQFIGTMSHEFTDFYHNVNAGDVEVIKNVDLTPFEKIAYNPDIHGANDIRDYTHNCVPPLAPKFIYLDPEFINKDINLIEIDPESNKINLNNIKKLNTFGLTYFSELNEKEIVAQHIYNNKLYRIYKTYEIRGNDPLFTTKAILRYEILDMAILASQGFVTIDISDDDDNLRESNSRISNDYIVEPRNIFIKNDKIYLTVERYVEYIHKYNDVDIDNTIFRYEIIQVCVNMFSGGFNKDSIFIKEYSEEVPDYEYKVTSIWRDSGKDKLIIVPSCRADLYYDEGSPENTRIDILFKQVLGHKATFDNTADGSPFVMPEEFALYYCTLNRAPILLYSKTDEPLVLDFGDSMGVCSSKNFVLFYYQVMRRGIVKNTWHYGKELNLDTGEIKNINFNFGGQSAPHGYTKILNVRGQYLIIRNNHNNIECIKMKVGLPDPGTELVFTHMVLTNNSYITPEQKDILSILNYIPRGGISQDFIFIDEIIYSNDFRILNRNLVLRDRFYAKYIGRDKKFQSTRSKGDFLDFIINYNYTQLEIDETKLAWFGAVNDIDDNGDIVVHAIRLEFMTSGFDSVNPVTGAVYFNNFELQLSSLFDLQYKEQATDITRRYTAEEYLLDSDILYEFFVDNETAFMFNRKQDTYIYFNANMLPSDRREYITELTYYENYSFDLPEAGFLISSDIFQMQSMIFWEKSATVSIKMLDDPPSTRKVVPVDSRTIRTRRYSLSFYNFNGVVNKINLRYAARMPYEPGDIMAFELQDARVDFTGPNAMLNRQYASFINPIPVRVINGTRHLQITANKIKDMNYNFKVEEQVVFFENGGPDLYESETLRPFTSINGTEFEFMVPDSMYRLMYMRDYADADNHPEDYIEQLPYEFLNNKILIQNVLPPKEYLLDFTGGLVTDITVNKRNVFDKYIDARDLDRPAFKKFTLPFPPTNYTFTLNSSNIAVKVKVSNHYFIVYYTNFEETGNELPRVLQATKLGGHPNTFLYWHNTQFEIAKTNYSYVRTATDEILCIEAAEEEIIVDGEVYTRWFHSSVNGVDDNGNTIDPVMLSDPDFVFNFLKSQGRMDMFIRLSLTNIADIVPSPTVVSPTFSVITNNRNVRYEFQTPASDVGLTNQETRQPGAVIRFFSDLSVQINLAEEAFSVERIFRGILVTNADGRKEIVIELDHPHFTSFYHRSDKPAGDARLAVTIDTYMPHLIATSENIELRVDFIKTLLEIDPGAETEGKTNDELWLEILRLERRATINLFITAEIVFPEQVAWNPHINLGTFYLNNQEFELLPDTQNKIFIASSDILSFSTVPLPAENSPIALINETTGAEYQRVYFLDGDGNYTIIKRQNIVFEDCWTGTLLNENVNINSIVMSEHRRLDSIDGVTLRLAEPIEPDKVIEISYKIKNSFCVNLDLINNRVLFVVHSVDQDARFRAKYTQNATMDTNINANPLTSINRGFVQLGGSI